MDVGFCLGISIFKIPFSTVAPISVGMIFSENGILRENDSIGSFL